MWGVTALSVTSQSSSFDVRCNSPVSDITVFTIWCELWQPFRFPVFWAKISATVLHWCVQQESKWLWTNQFSPAQSTQIQHHQSESMPTAPHMQSVIQSEVGGPVCDPVWGRWHAGPVCGERRWRRRVERRVERRELNSCLYCYFLYHYSYPVSLSFRNTICEQSCK